jgi:hypothetical protein
MSKTGTVVATLTAMILGATLGRLAADEPDSGYTIPKGTRAIAFKLHKDELIPDGAVPGTAIDIVGEIREPIKTGIALLNVKLLAVDSRLGLEDERPQAVTVHITTAQEEVLALMQKQGMRLRIRLHAKEKPKP